MLPSFIDLERDRVSASRESFRASFLSVSQTGEYVEVFSWPQYSVIADERDGKYVSWQRSERNTGSKRRRPETTSENPD